ncbi:alpha-ketoglutarate-dependent dioxygenase AlkB family protein [Zunongwangia endophytica]|uniref:Alpha-ketoglutarate-dependent dioxygenase AlkB family protein n=1 Tax=Zunongwangia endophytica TaxID=1808945 RepID=A0ABV8H9A9_9FLAO|nr:alpha-ketoglutarate-dependent dioxygenase AlkB [Zunongwangia endophytica]MDN3594970.1 alpha-ketoglutarate-dependent dioxygenase AlkB [Zunongwangia endophytica]
MQQFDLPQAKLIYDSDFLNSEFANSVFEELYNETNWIQEPIKIFGKEMMQPRLTNLFGKKSYSYSNIVMKPNPLPEVLLQLEEKIEEAADSKFNVCLANLYRDGRDSMGWHSDDEKELGKNPIIASVSLGGERMFHLQHKTKKELKQKFVLAHGSLLIMAGETQHYWKHQLPKTKKQVSPRINLTFRQILD